MILELIAGALLAAPVKPYVLLHQEQVLEFTASDHNVDVLRFMSAELEKTGKVLTAIFDKNDALIATALRTGEIKSWPEKPTRDDVFRTARTLRAEYVVICTVRRKGAEMEGSIELFRNRGGKPVWASQTTVSILKDGKLDPESGGLTIGSTWAAQMSGTPFKDLQADVPVVTPDPPDPIVKFQPKIDVDTAPYEAGMKAMQEGRLVEALALLRDAVDVQPLEAGPRLALIDALRQAGHPFMAAEEAARAAELIPADGRLLIAAAESWLEGGQPDKAYEMVQAVLNKNPKDAAALSVFGDLLMGRMEFARAAESYSSSIDAKADPETFFKRAQAYALQDEFTLSLQDLDRANSLGLSQEPDLAARRYRRNAVVLEPVFESFASSIRNMLKEAKATNDASIKTRAETLVKRVAAFQQYIEKINPPQEYARSHQQRALAMNLLYQSAKGVEKYAGDHNAETYGEAELLQIEAMREFAAAKSRFLQEAGTPRA